MCTLYYILYQSSTPTTIIITKISNFDDTILFLSNYKVYRNKLHIYPIVSITFC